MIRILAMSSQLILILLVGRSVSTNFPQSLARRPSWGNDPMMGIEGLPLLTDEADEEAGMGSPRTVIPTLPTQSCLEPSSHHQGGGSELASIRIDAATGERKTRLDRAQSEKQTGEAQAAVTLSNGAESIQMARLGSKRPEPKECTICLTEIDPSKPYLVEVWPGCQHEYHEECIQGSTRRTCPNCRGIRSNKIQALYRADDFDSHHYADDIDHQVERYTILKAYCLASLILFVIIMVLGTALSWSM